MVVKGTFCSLGKGQDERFMECAVWSGPRRHCWSGRASIHIHPRVATGALITCFNLPTADWASICHSKSIIASSHPFCLLQYLNTWCQLLTELGSQRRFFYFSIRCLFSFSFNIYPSSTPVFYFLSIVSTRRTFFFPLASFFPQLLAKGYGYFSFNHLLFF